MEKNDPQQYRALKDSGELEATTRNVQDLAHSEYESTLNALLRQEPAAEGLQNRQAQVERIRRHAEEIVTSSIVVPTPEWRQQQIEGYTDENTAHWSDEPLLPR